MSDETNDSPETAAGARDFIRAIVAEDLASGKHDRIVTRFPPEPNGFLHIGHAKAICLDFGLAAENDGTCHLRFDDTNPEAEDVRFAEAIEEDIRWLGFDWGDKLFHASDHFDTLYGYAQTLIRDGKAYVCSLDEEAIREYRGTVKDAGKPSPDRDRSAEESLDLLERMKAGEFAEGTYTVRAKIDMAASNMKMRDPLIYRIRRVPHPRTGTKWSVYPMYDFAHGLSDAIEGITHSLCTLEFENNRELYDWFVAQLPTPSTPRQIEFARLAISHTVMSKRMLAELVDEKHVEGWDDPRMPTIRGMRRRGYPAAAVRAFCEGVGIARRDDSVVDPAQLDFHVREELNKTALRAMAVVDPVKLTITNYPEGQSEELDADNNPEDEAAGTRKIPFSGSLWIERGDYLEDAPKKWFRLGPGREVRLKHAYFVTCTEAVRDDAGELVELRCTYDPDSRGGSSPDGRRVKGTLHWVSAEHAVDAELRNFGPLFSAEKPGAGGVDYRTQIDPESRSVVLGAKLEPSLASVEPGAPVQFMRQGYYCREAGADGEGLVFNRTVGLRDSWSKKAKQGGGK